MNTRDICDITTAVTAVSAIIKFTTITDLHWSAVFASKDQATYTVVIHVLHQYGKVKVTAVVERWSSLDDPDAPADTPSGPLFDTVLWQGEFSDFYVKAVKVHEFIATLEEKFNA